MYVLCGLRELFLVTLQMPIIPRSKEEEAILTVLGTLHFLLENVFSIIWFRSDPVIILIIVKEQLRMK